LVRDPLGILTLVEVKSEKASHFGGLSPRQKSRLQRVQALYGEREPTALKLLMAEGDHFLEIPVED